MRSVLDDERSEPLGILLVARLRNLAEMNRNLGRERVDLLLHAAAQMLTGLPEVEGGGAQVYRLNGSDFAVLLPNGSAELAETCATRVLQGFDRLYRQEFSELATPAAVGWTLYQRGEQVGDVLARADANLMRAEGLPQACFGSTANVMVSVARTEEWRERFVRAFQSNTFELALFPVVDVYGKLIHQEAMLRLVEINGERMIAGQFMPSASRLGLTDALDLLALDLVVARLQQGNDDIAMNISALSLRHPEFLIRFQERLAAAHGVATRLWVEVSERGIGGVDEWESLTAFSTMLNRHGVKLGIEHFGQHFSAIPRLHALSVDYLKLDGAFIADLDTNEGNQRFVKAVADIARSLNVMVIAERVQSDSEALVLGRLGVAGLTGPVVTARMP